MRAELQFNKKNIVVLGAGYCGVQIVKKLQKKLQSIPDYQIVLIDRKPSHTTIADLYEVATAYYPKVTDSSEQELRDTSSIPVETIYSKDDITFLEDEVEKIDYASKQVFLLKNKPVTFEYLVVALGSVTNFYGLPGVEEHAFPLKTVKNALALNTKLEDLFKSRWKKKNHDKIHIVVGGGGFTGVEFACELSLFIKKLRGKYDFQQNEVDIAVVQGGPQLVGLGERISNITMKRFKKLGVNAICGARISSFQNNQLEIFIKEKNEKQMLPADLLVWTAGIQPNPVLHSLNILNPDGALEVLPTLEAAHYPKVYSGGDNADIFDPKHHNFLPKLAQLALQEGDAIAYNILADIKKKPQKVYKPFFKGFIIALGGKYFVYKGFVTFSGIIPWMMRRFLDLSYFARRMPLHQAVKKWWKTEKIFMQND